MEDGSRQSCAPIAPQQIALHQDTSGPPNPICRALSLCGPHNDAARALHSGGLPLPIPVHQGRPRVHAEMNRIHLVLFGMHNNMFGPYLNFGLYTFPLIITMWHRVPKHSDATTCSAHHGLGPQTQIANPKACSIPARHPQLQRLIGRRRSRPCSATHRAASSRARPPQRCRRRACARPAAAAGTPAAPSPSPAAPAHRCGATASPALPPAPSALPQPPCSKSVGQSVSAHHNGRVGR
jgi:hypothetical protein